MNADKDSGNISKDGLTGLKSKAYFLVSLENSIAKLALPNPSQNTGVVSVYLGNALEDDLQAIATLVDMQADYATHYKSGMQDVIAGVYEGSEAPLSAIEANLQSVLSGKFPKLKFGVAHVPVDKEGNAEQVLDQVARNAYDAMILQKPAV